ncbi:hypothetical protein AWB93_20855 [Mycobacterium bohemicum]|uniref:Toprim domain-containing protein n=1 Tax=Mycobacterium bohemicum TaxID=56425 RepID=A0A1X1QYB5_MYCBE|nr:hypothetical protein AWB93_20855 [Mycobacterium bohemicum]
MVLHCHAGCDLAAVLGALELGARDLFDDGPMRAAYSERNTYVYPDGRKVYRKPGKRFHQGGNTKGTSLFHAERITSHTTTVYVVEGEKDVLAAEGVGAVAVCPPQGAGQKLDRYDWTPLHKKHVTVVADKDEPGDKHGRQVAELLHGNAASVQIMQAACGKDLADHIAAGRNLAELIAPPSESVSAVNGAVQSQPREGEPEAGAGVMDMPRLWKATELRGAQQPRWLAKGRLPYCAVSLLIGDEGIGKSLFWVWITAAVTTGKPLPEFGIPARPASDVIVVCTEDDWAETVRPRLEVADVDMNMVRVICTEQDGSGAPVFPRDLFLIREADPVPALIVVDAWLDTVSPGLSVRDPQQARQALHPWKEIATATGAAVLLLTHTNRVASPNARDRYGASYALRQKARLTLYAQQDDEGLLLIGPEKANSTAAVAASRFAITGKPFFPAAEEHDGTVPLLSYIGESDRTAREHVAASVEEGADEPGGNPAKTFIYQYLIGHSGEAPAVDVLKEGRKAGFGEQELKDARRRHRAPRIVSRKASMGEGWVWAIAYEGGEQPRDDPEGGEDGTKVDTPSTLPPSPPSADLPPSAGPANGASSHPRGHAPRARETFDGPDNGPVDEMVRAGGIPRRVGCLCQHKPNACHWCRQAARHTNEPL